MSDRSLVRMLSKTVCLAVLLMTAFAVSTPVFAQATGRIAGLVTDASSSQPLASAMVTVVGTNVGTLTGPDGRYMLTAVPFGSVTLRVQTIGYAPRTTAAITISDNTLREQNVKLEMQVVELSALNITGAVGKKGSVARALDVQRSASGIVNAISSEQMSRSPDGDAAAAMQRVSGATVTDGKYVSVRGLGERYTTTSLNGAKIPSPEPEKRIVPLDLFPAGLLESITTSKTFTPDQSGDFSGGQVNIKTRDFALARLVTFSSSFGLNDRVAGYSQYTAPRTGAEWLGFGGSGRALPVPLQAAGDFQQQLNASQYNALVGAFRNAWSVNERTGTGNYSLGGSVGGTDAVFGQAISYLGSLSYSYGEEVRHGEIRARALAGDAGTTLEVDRFAGSTGRSSVLWGGMANLSTLLGQSTRVYLNNTYNRSAENEARFESGVSENFGNIPLQINRLKYVERDVYSTQLGASHALTATQSVDWTGTLSGVSRNEPDRSEIVYAQQADPATGALLPSAWMSVNSEGAVRTFGRLDERALEAAANYKLSFGKAGTNGIKVGGLFRNTSRDAFNKAYSISSLTLPTTARELRPEEIFDGRFTSEGQGHFNVSPLGAGGTYTARENLGAVFGMLDFDLSTRLHLIAGARVEHSEVEVVSQGTVSTDTARTSPSFTDFLPSLALNAKLSESQSVRLSVSQTLSRPEYRELANLQYRDVIGGENVVGNPDLVRTLIRNADVRWEWYPRDGEIVSVALFGKQFQNPIERVYRATSGTSIATFVNADGARTLGVELELRKQLGSFWTALESMSAFTNVTLMDSKIDIAESASSATNSNRAMVGQAPYVVNAGLTYSPAESDISATALFNIVGRRITTAGELPLPDVYEQARAVLDLSVRAPLRRGMSVKFDARNLLDEEYELVQGSVVREKYRTGRSFSFGVTWTR